MSRNEIEKSVLETLIEFSDDSLPDSLPELIPFVKKEPT